MIGAMISLTDQYNLVLINNKKEIKRGDIPVREVQEVSPVYQNRAIRRDDLGKQIDVYV